MSNVKIFIKCVVVIYCIFGLIFTSTAENAPVLKDIEVAVKQLQNLRKRVHKLKGKLKALEE